MAAKKTNPKRMSEERFIQDISENYRAGVRYCFILGSGASFKSGIPTGLKLIQQWRNELLELEKKCKGYIRESAKAAGIHLTDKEYERLFETPDFQAESEDYFTFFDIRYEGKAPVAYRFLQKIMGDAKPSFGYYALSEFLVKTENKLVITTNFDTLTEDTIYFSQLQHPLVLGHESLAAYIGQAENVGRPVVAKVHRDLFYQPLNTKKEMEKLAEQWEVPLRNALNNYVPVVIGYGGGDRTLMTLLDKLNLRGLYWCVMRNGETERISKLVEKQKGYLVDIRGFDQIILKLVTDFYGDADWRYVHPTENIRHAEEDRIRRYEDSYDELLKSEPSAKPPILEKEYLTDAAGEKGKALPAKSDEDIRFEQEDRKEILEDMNKLESKQPESEKTRLRQLRLEAAKEHEEGNQEKALQLCEEAIGLSPEDPKLFELKSDILFALGKQDEARSGTDRALALWTKTGTEATNAQITDAGDTATMLWFRSLNLFQLGRLQEALSYSEASVAEDPGHSSYHYLKSIVLKNMKHYSEALCAINDALALNPSNKDFLEHRIDVYEALGQTAEAEQDRKTLMKLKYQI